MSKKYFSLIYAGEICRGKSKQKVIPSSAFAELLSAREVLDQAKKDVSFYFEENKKECEKILKKAKQEGFKEGLSRFNEHILRYEQKIKELEHKMQQQILPIALKAAKRIVSTELQASPETIVDIVSNTLKSVTQSHRIKIFVNKKDRPFIEEAKEKLKEPFDHVKIFLIEEKEDVESGGCIIETEAGIINASLKNQWQALEAAFRAFMSK